MSQEPPESSGSWQTYDPAGGSEQPPAATGAASRCPMCRGDRTEDGFLEDVGQGSRGFIQWVVGPLERGIFGGARRMGKTRLQVAGKRCVGCGYVMLFATSQV